MPNRLSEATSPYLLQHAENPVEWWPWGEEAFAEARRRDVPVLVSVGYAACHWCHVMAHESFEDEATAARMNAHFVNVKVDREERPDVDAVYMEATQAMTGQGGWPMTVFATPDGAPFYCGTYFPRDHFQRLLEGVATAWRDKRPELLDQGRRVVDALGAPRTLPSAPPPSADQLDLAVHALVRDYDSLEGGFGDAPKFPPSMLLSFLTAQDERTRPFPSTGATENRPTAPYGAALHRSAPPSPASDTAESTPAWLMATGTALAMAQGGMYDQLGGGFARYSVDRAWVVPHFEKMLYDNALLLRAYLRMGRRPARPGAATADTAVHALLRRVAEETADWMLRDLRTPEGGFASALDADSEGEEGTYYVWTPAQLREVLGEEDAAFAADVFGVTDEGTFEHGSSVLRLPVPPADTWRFQRVRDALLAARAERVAPARDDKVVAAWNGLAIAGLAEAGALLERPDLVDAARDAAELLLSVHLRDGRLARTSRDGRAGTSAGVLEDYGDVAEGLLALHGVTGEPRYAHEAGRLLDAVLEHFGDGEGGFFDTADDAEKLFSRPQDPTDNATPSGRSAVASALVTYAALTGSERHRTAAEGALSPVALLAEKAARFAGWGLAAGEAALSGPRAVAVVGDPGDPRTEELVRTALAWAPLGTALSRGDGRDDGGVPLLRDRAPVGGVPTAYVCEGFVCKLPVTSPEDLRTQLLA
ncbi:thioredoxin domain-containing protein [Nocardiopsis sp. CT-R113]|uniref:Thioredoxin domain-containing protein n=1 Tax=Nocardiopsis codii TaxID=3065942 RepID=A0ABU7K8H4_9ACTN|nr:thioredoxin domain-containing protein [Nocardiopsis sp. CT-R113]MEE2037872.1 thioredoxin domain-containing protein [Nocardiopsis sp. CT-R113]